MIPETVRSLADINELGGDEQLIHAVSLLDFLLAASPAYRRGESETLGAVVNRHRSGFSNIADLKFALKVRNKIVHPRPGNADDPDLSPAAVSRAARYIVEAIQQDVAPEVPPEIRSVLLSEEQAIGGRGAEASAEPPYQYVAGWRYELAPSHDPRSPGIGSRSTDAVPSADEPTGWRAAAKSLQSASPAAFWGVMSCVPAVLFITWLAVRKLSSLLPGNLLLHGLVLLLLITSIRWLRSS